MFGQSRTTQNLSFFGEFSPPNDAFQRSTVNLNNLHRPLFGRSSEGQQFSHFGKDLVPQEPKRSRLVFDHDLQEEVIELGDSEDDAEIDSDDDSSWIVSDKSDCEQSNESDCEQSNDESDCESNLPSIKELKAVVKTLSETADKMLASIKMLAQLQHCS